jgi:peptide/nickel transport system permease protein
VLRLSPRREERRREIAPRLALRLIVGGALDGVSSAQAGTLPKGWLPAFYSLGGAFSGHRRQGKGRSERAHVGAWLASRLLNQRESGMLLFTAKRLLQALPILLGVSLVVFGLLQLAPGNPIDMLLPPEATPDVIAQMQAAYGFDKPLYVQYFDWLGHVIRGDLGISIFSGQPVLTELSVALGNTLILAIPAALLGFSIGIAIGIVAALNNGKWPDKVFSTIAIAGVSVPHYWFAIMMVTVFSVVFNLLPAEGMGDGGFPATFDQARYLIMPVITLSLIPMGIIARLVRATVLDILNQEFISALAAKGIGRARILWHVVKNASPPVLAIMGLQFGYLLGGSILVETVFNWPGSGNLIGLAIFRRDVPMLQGAILVLASFFVVLNLVVDLAQALIDPRLRR